MFTGFLIKIMDLYHFTFKDQNETFENYLDTYFKNKSPDCILYSQGGGEFRIHKEIFSQTDFLREFLTSAKEHCCGIVEVLCPCSKEELAHLVNFLYDGEIQCQSQNDSIKIQENLSKIFGFPKNLNMNDFGQTSMNNQNCSQDEDITGAVNNNLVPNETVETMLLQNSDETLI